MQHNLADVLRHATPRCMRCTQDDVELVGRHDDMFKRTISRKDVWESPRAPFEVQKRHVAKSVWLFHAAHNCSMDSAQVELVSDVPLQSISHPSTLQRARQCSKDKDLSAIMGAF